MSTLYLLSFLSMAGCIGLTYWAARHPDKGHQGQSISESMKEAWSNIIIGFTINYIANWAILPMVPSFQGTELNALDNFMMGWIYTVISMVRSFGIRRWHDRQTRKRLSSIDSEHIKTA